MNLPIIDLVFLIIVLGVSLVACIRGFINEIFGKGAPVVAVWIAFLFYKQVIPQMGKFVSIPWLCTLLSFLIIFIIAYIVLKLIQLLLGKIFSGKILGSLDRILGFAFGLIEGFAIVAIILLILEVQPWFDVKELLEGSVFLKILSPFVDVPRKTITDAVKSIA